MPTEVSDDGSVTVRNPSPPPPLSKTMPETARPGDRFVVPVTMTTPAGAAYLDLTAIDTLPDGLAFVGYSGVTCQLVGGGDCPAWPIVELAAVAADDGSTQLGWFFGDLPSADTDRLFTMSYTVEVKDTYQDGSPVADGDVLTNTVQGYSNDQNLLGDTTAIPDLGAFDYTGEPAVDSTLVALPLVVIDKVASTTGPLVGGEDVTYTLTLRNLGLGTAHSIRVADTPTGGVTAVTAVGHAEWLTKGWTAASPQLTWLVPTLAGGQAVDLTYTVSVDDDVVALIDAGTGSLDNAAKIVDYRDGPRRSVNTQTIAGGDPVAVSIPYAGSGVSVAKFVGGCAGEAETLIPGSQVEWCILVTNASDTAAPGVLVSDRLPSEFAYVAASATIAGAAAEGDRCDRTERVGGNPIRHRCVPRCVGYRPKRGGYLALDNRRRGHRISVGHLGES